MLSRVAESIYWMSRYIERAENVARFVHVNLNLMLDSPFPAENQQWEALVAASGDTEAFKERYDVATEENVIQFLTFDERNPNSIYSCLVAARENGRTIRDTISSEMWEHLNNFYLMVKEQSQKRKVEDLHTFFTQVKMSSHLFVGLADSTMSHGEGWQFARLGRLLERADKTARILDVKYFILLPSMEQVDSPLDSLVLGALLKSTSAFEMYRKRFNRIHYKDVCDFLIFDPKFPRSIKYCIKFAQTSLDLIVEGSDWKCSAVGELAILADAITAADNVQIVNGGLHEFIDVFQFNLNVVGKEIHNSFFAKKPLMRQNQ